MKSLQSTVIVELNVQQGILLANLNAGKGVYRFVMLKLSLPDGTMV